MPSITWSPVYSGPYSALYVNDAQVIARRVVAQARADDLIAAMRVLSEDDRTEVYYYMNMHVCKDCGESREHLPWGHLRHCSCTRDD